MNNEYEVFLEKEIFGEIGKKYKINKYIGQGGNGFVFECTNANSDVFVAKILYTTSTIKIESFKKEIKIQKSLNSKYIVKCIDCGEIKLTKKSKPKPFYIMKKYDCSLEDLLSENRVSPLDAYKYSIQLCMALKKMHKKREPLIHRDLKPENILFDKKNNSVLICDFGLTHIENENKTFNDTFKGNVDYHAPEQKKRGNKQVGTYTDIYSLGLIINAMFTKEIAQGENYKKIWEIAPHFSFIDSIVNRMIQHDIQKREKDISVVLMELEAHDMEYEVEESFLKNMCDQANLPAEKVGEIMNLFSLANHFFDNAVNDKIVNINYCCDYHFDCNELMMNSLLVLNVYDDVVSKFNYEANCFNDSYVPYEPLDIANNEDKKLFNSLVKIVDSLKIYDDLFYVKRRLKKYFLSITNYHAREVLEAIDRYKEEINSYCINSPILYCVLYVKEKLSIVEKRNIHPSNFMKLVKYEESDNTDKDKLFFNEYDDYDKLVNMIREKIDGLSYMIKDKKLKLFFDSIQQEQEFENLLEDIMGRLPENDVRIYDIQDIIENEEGFSIQKIYSLDLADAKTLITYYI